MLSVRWGRAGQPVFRGAKLSRLGVSLSGGVTTLGVPTYQGVLGLVFFVFVSVTKI